MEKNKPYLDKFFARLRRRRRLYWIWNTTKFLFWLLIFLIVAGWFLLQSPRFQNWAVQQTTTYLSKELNTDIKVERIDIDFFNKLVLEDFYVADQKGDTLLYSQELRTSLSATLISLIHKELDVDEIYLKNIEFNLRTAKGEKNHNLQFILDYLVDPTKKKKQQPDQDTVSNTLSPPDAPSGRPFILDIDAVYLTNIKFILDNQPGGTFVEAVVPNASIIVDTIDLVGQLLHIKDLELNEPLVNVVFKEKETIDKDKDKDKSDSSKGEPSLFVDRFSLTKGSFSLDDFKSEENKTFKDAIDFKHLLFPKLQMEIRDFSFDKGNIEAVIENINLEEKSGFALNKFAANRFSLTDRRIELIGLDVETPGSQLRDTLLFKYRSLDDFGNFKEKVLIDARLQDSRFAIHDLTYFVPKLKNNPFFIQNKDEIVTIDGRVSGRINNLRGRDLNIELGKSTTIQGDFSSRNLTVKGEEALNLNLTRLSTDIQTLRLLIPGFVPPRNFDKLGRINFTGRFDGFFTDFVAFGALDTDVGNARMDMRMNLRDGRDRAAYSGTLALNDFDLAKWADDDRFGKITFNSEVKQGVGLTLETVNASLVSQIQSFSFKGYNYEKVDFTGTLNKNLFDGQLNIDDENADLSFDGTINFADSLPQFNFAADIETLDLFALNLSKEKYALGGKMDIQLRDKELDRIEGTIAIRDFVLVKDSLEFSADSLFVESKLRDAKNRKLTFESDVIDFSIDGQFKIEKIPNVFTSYLANHYPQLADRFGVNPPQKKYTTQRFYYELELEDSRNLTNMFIPKLDTLKDIELVGFVDTDIDTMYIDLEARTLTYDDVVLDDIFFNLESNATEGILNAGVYHTQLKGGQDLNPLRLEAILRPDTIDFEVNATNFTTVLDNLNLPGQLTINDEYIQISFLPKDIVIYRQKWAIDPSNFLRIGKKKIETRDFKLFNSTGQYLEVRSLRDQKGIDAHIGGFDLSFIDEIWDYKNLDFNGGFIVDVQVADLFHLKDISLGISADTLLINGDDWGALRVDATMPDIKSPAQADLSITRPDINRQLIAEAYFVPDEKNKESWMQHTYQIKGDIKNYPLYIAEYWIADGVDNTRGDFDGKVRIWGGDKPQIEGEVDVRNLETTIEYLQTRYSTPSGKMIINNDFLFDASNNYIYDEEGNRAELVGGITHKNLRNMALDAAVISDKFLVLNTTKEDNPVYYGKAVMGGEVRFSGNFDYTDIDINGRSGEDSELFIPVTEERSASEIKFIELINKEDVRLNEEEQKGKSDPKGVQVSINLSFNDKAQVSMIFDEKTNDIIKGRGNGDVQLFVPRGGEDITMFGNYDITEGEYLYTLLKFINKPFKVKQGGTIRWNGSPYEAELDLQAAYTGLNTPLYNFLVEYLNDPRIQAEARNSTSVNLIMDLKGNMRQPSITFDIEFPQLINGELRSYTESKMRILRDDENELNRQVFGLMVIGSFLPAGQSTLEGSGSLIPFNTVSEWFANQLSMYLTEVLSEVFVGVEGVSAIDFDVNYNFYQLNDISINDDQLVRNGSELQLELSVLLNDRLEINVGGNIDWSSTGAGSGTSGAFLAGEFVLEYALTENRQLKVRLYGLSDQTLVSQNQRRFQYGVGLSYRKEFDTFSEFISGMKKSARKAVTLNPKNNN